MKGFIQWLLGLFRKPVKEPPVFSDPVNTGDVVRVEPTVLPDHPPVDHQTRPWPPVVTAAMLGAIALYAKEASFQRFVDPLRGVFISYQIDTPLRIAHFLGQVMHESGEFRWLEEIASGDAYEFRLDLGNTQPGDGRRYKGRGLIQLTGRSHYLEYSLYLRGAEDFILNPERVAKLPWAVDVAGWYWSRRRNINPMADRDDLIAITKAINGGTRGLDERRRYLERAKHTLGIA